MKVDSSGSKQRGSGKEKQHYGRARCQRQSVRQRDDRWSHLLADDPEELHAMGRMNGLGNYVRTRDAFVTVPRISYEEWE